MMLKLTCTTATLRAFLLTPILDKRAVTHVPIFCPMMIGSAVPYVTVPVKVSACRIPTEADELCMIPVTTAPANTPSKGLVNKTRKFAKLWLSASGFMASPIISIPNIKTAKPTITVPISLLLLFFETIIRKIPAIAITGEKEVGFNKLTNTLSLSMPVRLKIQAVTVVPMLEPIITPMLCLRVIMPN